MLLKKTPSTQRPCFTVKSNELLTNLKKNGEWCFTLLVAGKTSTGTFGGGKVSGATYSTKADTSVSGFASDYRKTRLKEGDHTSSFFFWSNVQQVLFLTFRRYYYVNCRRLDLWLCVQYRCLEFCFLLCFFNSANTLSQSC